MGKTCHVYIDYLDSDKPLFGLLINRNIQKNNKENQRDEVIGIIVSTVFNAINRDADLDDAIHQVQIRANKVSRLFGIKVASIVNDIAAGLSKLKRAKNESGFNEPEDTIIKTIKENTASLSIRANRKTNGIFGYGLSRHEHLTDEEIIDLIFSDKMGRRE